MSLIKNHEKPSRVRSTVDTVLLKSLLNKELNAQASVFNVTVAFVTASNTWQATVEHFKHTSTRVQPESLGEQKKMVTLAKELADKVRNAIAAKESSSLKSEGEKA